MHPVPKFLPFYCREFLKAFKAIEIGKNLKIFIKLHQAMGDIFNLADYAYNQGRLLMLGSY